MKHTPEKNPETIALTLAGDGNLPVAALFGKGVRLRVRTGASLRKMLCDQLGMAEAYLDDRIQTIFMDGHPVDDVDRAVVQDGAVVSLSAAMPGLVGATLRRGGHLAAFRNSISYSGYEKEQPAGNGTMTIKLFNMVARELGPGFLERGVFVSGKDLGALLKAAPADAVIGIERNDAPASTVDLADLLDSDAEVFLKVERLAEDGSKADDD